MSDNTTDSPRYGGATGLAQCFVIGIAQHPRQPREGRRRHPAGLRDGAQRPRRHIDRVPRDVIRRRPQLGAEIGIMRADAVLDRLGGRHGIPLVLKTTVSNAFFVVNL